MASLNPLTQKMSSAFASKYIDRVTKITERLNDLHLNIEQEKFMKLESVDQKIEQVDDKILDWHENNNKKFNIFRDRINEFTKYIDEDKQAKEYQHEARLQELKTLEAKI